MEKRVVPHGIETATPHIPIPYPSIIPVTLPGQLFHTGLCRPGVDDVYPVVLSILRDAVV